MDFYQLIYFKKVAETRSLSRAADELRITQPAVSKQVRSLEKELGEQLLDRIGKKVFLTRAGELLLSYANKILQSIDEAKIAVKDLSQECSGELVIGTSDHISIHRLPDVLKTCINTFPKIELKLRCHRSETILAMVLRNEVDLGVITIQNTPPNIISRVIWKDTMSAVAPIGHPLTKTKKIQLKDIASYGMILPERTTETRTIIDTVFAEKKLSPKITMEVAYIETIKSLVKSGLGIAIIPDKAVESEIRNGDLVKLPIMDAIFLRNLGVIYLKNKFLSRAACEFLKLLAPQNEKGEYHL